MLKLSNMILFTSLLVSTMSCSTNDNLQNNNNHHQTNQALANIDNQLANLELKKTQVNQQYGACLASIQVPQMPNYYFGGDDVDITLAQGNAILAQTDQMTTCGQTANYQLNQIEYNRSSLLYQRSMLEQQNRVTSLPPATTNNPAQSTPTLPPASTSVPNPYSQRAYEAHQRELELIREQGNFNLRKDCNNSGGTWGGRNIGCY